MTKVQLARHKLTVMEDPDEVGHSIIIEEYIPAILPAREYKPVPNVLVDQVCHDLRIGRRVDFKWKLKEG